MSIYLCKNYDEILPCRRQEKKIINDKPYYFCKNPTCAYATKISEQLQKKMNILIGKKNSVDYDEIEDEMEDEQTEKKMNSGD